MHTPSQPLIGTGGMYGHFPVPAQTPWSPGANSQNPNMGMAKIRTTPSNSTLLTYLSSHSQVPRLPNHAHALPTPHRDRRHVWTFSRPCADPLATFGPLPESMICKFIIVLIDTFTRYVELFPSQMVSATSATDALWKHFCRFTTPLEIMTDQGPQFMN
jgi:hypothetical protein